MRYDESHRPGSLGSVWLRFKLRMSGYPWLHPVILPDFDGLSDHQRRDIGVPEPIRHMDWKALQDVGRL